MCTSVFTPREMDLCVSTNMVKISSEPQECPQMCPKLFDPVCASNGKEAKLFYSECHMNMMNCNLKTGENDRKSILDTFCLEYVNIKHPFIILSNSVYTKGNRIM